MRGVLENRKGQLGNLQGIVMALVVIGIILGVGFLVLNEFKGQLTTGSDAQTAVNQTIAAMAKVPTWLSIIVVIAIVGILLAIVFNALPTSRTQV